MNWLGFLGATLSAIGIALSVAAVVVAPPVGALAIGVTSTFTLVGVGFGAYGVYEGIAATHATRLKDREKRALSSVISGGADTALSLWGLWRAASAAAKAAARAAAQASLNAETKISFTNINIMMGGVNKTNPGGGAGAAAAGAADNAAAAGSRSSSISSTYSITPSMRERLSKLRGSTAEPGIDRFTQTDTFIGGQNTKIFTNPKENIDYSLFEIEKPLSGSTPQQSRSGSVTSVEDLGGKGSGGGGGGSGGGGGGVVGAVEEIRQKKVYGVGPAGHFGTITSPNGRFWF